MSQYHNPPKWPLKLFRFYCNSARLEEIEGDLCEEYNEFISRSGTRYSAIFYWWLVIRSFRSYALKRKKMKNTGLIGTFFMFLKHNLVVNWRDILKNKTTSAINIAGLAIGISAFLVIYRIITYELSFNQHFPDKERIFRVYSEFSGAFSGFNRGVSTAVPGYMRENLTGIESVAHFHNFGAKVSITDENGNPKKLDHNSAIILADETYFEIADQYEWLSGSATQSLTAPFQVVLTEAQARTYFGYDEIEDIVGKTVTYRDSLEVMVSGVVRGPAENSDFQFTEMISFATLESSWLKDRYDMNDWSNTNSSSQSWIKLHEDTDVDAFNTQLELLNDFAAGQEEDATWIKKYRLQPLSDLHYNANLGVFDSGASAIHLPTLRILSVVAFFLLLIAAFNFINLETAQATNKSREVGVRKVLGSSRTHLIGRFLSGSIMVTFLAILAAIPISYFSLDAFSEFIPEEVTLGLTEAGFWIVVLVTGLTVGFLSGLYPSMIMAKFTPISALKSGAIRDGRSQKSYLRMSLITLQFVFSQLLIIGTLTVIYQISYMLDRDLGFEKEGIVYFFAPHRQTVDKMEVLENKLKQLPEILDISRHQNPPAYRGYSTSTLKYLKGDEEIVTNAHRRQGDKNYLDFYQIDLVAGRNVIGSENTNEVVINETYIKELGYHNPEKVIGAKLGDDYVVVGVMEDIHFQSLHHKIEPMFYKFSETYGRCIALKINMNGDLQDIIQKISDNWDLVYPDDPMDLRFMDETVERFYKTERKTSKLASTATGIAILISCLGLFGLISFTIIQRAKEMGIRKVLGASVLQIGSVLSREFITLIVLAFIISVPISYMIIQKWMGDFAYQTNISWWIYATGGLLSLLIAIGTISVKIWKASYSNPVDSLRYE